MDEEVKNIIKYRKPLTKVSLVGPKFFLKDSSLEAQKLVTKHLESLENVLKNKKIDKRCSRVQAEWDSSLNLARVNNVVKGLLQKFGYQDKNGIYMYPEEMLYLVETNRMEVSVNSVPLTVQECYSIVLNCPGMKLNKYRVYKKLIQQGYKVIRYSEIIRKGNIIEENGDIIFRKGKIDLQNYPENKIQNLDNKKHDLEDSEQRNVKRICKEENRPDKLSFTKKYVLNLHEQLHQMVPQQYTTENQTNSSPDYYIFKSNTPYLKVYICETNVVDHAKSSSTQPTMYAICSEDNTSFYNMGIVNIPSIDLNLDII